MKKVLVIIVLLLQIMATAQEEPSKFEHFKLEAGVLVPLGNLKSKIGLSQQYGFWYRTRMEHNDLLDLGFNLVVPTIRNSFEYQGKDSIFHVKPKGLTIMVGCRMNKLYHISLLRNKATIEWSSTFGGSFLSFEDKENPEDTSGYYLDGNGNYSYHIDTNTKALSCIYAAQGVSVTCKNIGFQINYNFTPYTWFTKRIENDFGRSSLSLQLSCKL